jgi:hypothetical protein
MKATSDKPTAKERAGPDPVFSHVLVGVDGSPESGEATRRPHSFSRTKGS